MRVMPAATTLGVGGPHQAWNDDARLPDVGRPVVRAMPPMLLRSGYMPLPGAAPATRPGDPHRWAGVTVSRRVPAVLVGVAAAVIAACGALLALLVLRPDLGERHTAGVDPSLRYDPADLDLLEQGEALPIAHNSGDSLSAARQALAHGARAIEVDVALIGGRLYAAHDEPHRLVGSRFTRRPTLSAVWRATEAAELLVLDLKSSSRRFARALVDFLDRHDDEDRAVLLVSRHEHTIERLTAARPSTPVLLSVGDRASLDRARETDDLPVAGLSVRHQLVDAELIAELADRDWILLAWTVGDPSTYAELAGLGVTAVATDNLAIVEAMAGIPELAVPMVTLTTPTTEPPT